MAKSIFGVLAITTAVAKNIMACTRITSLVTMILGIKPSMKVVQLETLANLRLEPWLTENLRSLQHQQLLAKS